MRNKHVLREKKSYFDQLATKKEKPSTLKEALRLLKEAPTLNFLESIDVAIKLGIDPKNSSQNVRGAVLLPEGLGKVVRVAVFAEGSEAEEAKAAGADFVGKEELAEKLKSGECVVDVVLATPGLMPFVGRLGSVLGPRGLMPNPKEGTVLLNPASMITNIKKGQLRFKNDKFGFIHGSVGKIDFSEERLEENIKALTLAVKKLRSATTKGSFFRKLLVSSTMSKSIEIPLGSLEWLR